VPLTLVVLAAGLGTRFGGIKQLAPIGPRGEAIVDILLERAAAGGFERAVVVVREEIAAAVHEHLEARGTRPLPIALVEQPPLGGRHTPAGTAHAALAGGRAATDRFAVVNADDLYPAGAFALLAARLASAPPDEHVLVGFPVSATIATDRPVSRAVIECDANDRLARLTEGTVTPTRDGYRFDAAASGASFDLAPSTLVSMNMWGFNRSILDLLANTVDEHIADGARGEARLPDVVAALVVSDTTVRVVTCHERCFGLTHREDVPVVRAALQ
jgi:NDP-sugar pyrophosphorylase family protein